jgi:hypothetical protein
MFPLRSVSSFKHLLPILFFGAAVLEMLLLFLGPDGAAAWKEIQTAKAAGERPGWETLADFGVSLAAVINLGLLLVLALTARWWKKPLSAVEAETVAPARASWQRWWMPVVMVIFSAWYGYASFGGKSLWWDEIWSLRQCVHGQWKVETKNGQEVEKFSETTWKRCAFYYSKPTNHPTMSLLQKASLTAWKLVTGAEKGEFSEMAFRLPAFIGSGVAVVLLLRIIGIARGVMLLGVLLALHPWHLRYGVEARAYALVVPLCLSGILASRKVLATRGRSLGAWAWLAVNQALWIYSFIPAVLDVGLMFLVTMVWLWKQEKTTADRVGVVLRHLVAHTVAAMIWMQAFLPNLVQIPFISEPGNAPQKLDDQLMLTTMNQLLFGMEWNRTHADSLEAQHLTSVMKVARSAPMAGMALVLALSLAVRGWRAGLRRTPVIGSLLLVPLGAAVLHLTLSRLTGSYFYPRFIISLLPIVVAGWALFPQALADYTQTQRKIALGFMVAYALFTAPQRSVLSSVAYTGYKDVAEYIKSRPTEPSVAIFGLGREAFPSYYPKAFGTSEIAEVEKLATEAKAQNKDFLVVLGYPFFHKDILPEGWRVLNDSARFREVKAFPGLEPDFYFRVMEAVK